MHITVWNEGVHEQNNPTMAATYPQGMHGAIAEGLTSLLPSDAVVRTAVLADPEQGLANLDDTDVLCWWGHVAHDQVSDESVQRVYDRVLEGMGLVVLHSGHFSRIFKKLMGTTCSLAWRNEGEREL